LTLSLGDTSAFGSCYTDALLETNDDDDYEEDYRVVQGEVEHILRKQRKLGEVWMRTSGDVLA